MDNLTQKFTNPNNTPLEEIESTIEHFFQQARDYAAKNMHVELSPPTSKIPLDDFGVIYSWSNDHCDVALSFRAFAMEGTFQVYNKETQCVAVEESGFLDDVKLTKKVFRYLAVWCDKEEFTETKSGVGDHTQSLVDSDKERNSAYLAMKEAAERVVNSCPEKYRDSVDVVHADDGESISVSWTNSYRHVKVDVLMRIGEPPRLSFDISLETGEPVDSSVLETLVTSLYEEPIEEGCYVLY